MMFDVFIYVYVLAYFGCFWKIIFFSIIFYIFFFSKMSHIDLLRTEYIKLQTKYAELQRSYDILASSRALSHSENFLNTTTTNFVHRLLRIIVTKLYDKDLYSDITIHVDGHQLRGHRFVIAARTDFWGDLSSIERLELSEMSYNVAKILIRWMYTDFIDEQIGVSIILPLLEASIKYQFDDLKARCEEMLMALIDVENCVQIYQFSETHSLERLRECCGELVSLRWNEFTPEHFEDMPAQLLYRLMKRKSSSLLSSIIRLQREDVLFLFLTEQDQSNLRVILNEFDCNGQLPLDIAFELSQLKMAKGLASYGADLNKLDEKCDTFLWKAIKKGNIEVCDFIVENGANINYVHEETGDTLMHVLASSNVSDSTCQWISAKLDHFDVNALDKKGRTPLIVAVEHENFDILDLFLKQSQLDINKQDNSSRNALEITLLEKYNLEIAEILTSFEGIDLNCFNHQKETILHKSVKNSNLVAIQFLVKHGIKVDSVDINGTTPLHQLMKTIPSHEQQINSKHIDILKILLKSGANPTVIDNSVGRSALHSAVEKPIEVLEILLNFCSAESLCPLDKDANSPIWCALLAGKFEMARLFLNAGADINERSPSGFPLLIKAISSKRDDIAQFLLANNAIAAVTSPDGFSPLNLAVQNGLTSTVNQLCKLGANLNHPNPHTGLLPLWTALENEDYGTADILVTHGADLEGWCANEEQTMDLTFLHRTIDKNNQKGAIFLIKSGCNVNALRSIRNSSSEHKLDSSNTFVTELFTQSKQTPLHTTVDRALTDVSKALISNLNCRIDAQDVDGRTAAHIAILKNDTQTLELLLSHPDHSHLSMRDRYGQTPLALAIRKKRNKMAEAICKRVPHAAVQFNGSGENLLHCAVKSSELEAVLFLLGMHVDVNIPSQDKERNTALHIAARVGDELILRNLMLAGADVNAKNAAGQTAITIAAMNGHTDICKALLENGADPNIVDVNGNNVLHTAVSHGEMQTTQLLLQESQVDIMAVNKRQQNILHLCAINIGLISAEIFMTILEAHPNYPLEVIDMSGSTMFLLGFINGNSDLCKLALKNGACMGVMNNHGQTVFNFSTPTQQLLFGLLEGLEKEPKWAEGDICSECGTKFTLTMRKHHCRHCGRLVCAKCSEQQIPILKYNLPKNVRVCQICYDVLTMGAPQ